MLLVGCGDKPSPEPEEDLPAEEVIEEPVEEPSGDETGEETSEEPVEEPEEEDPLAVLRISEEYAREEEIVCLKRGDNFYSLGYETDRFPNYNYLSGAVSKEKVDLYGTFSLEERRITESCGELPIPILESDDEVVYYSLSNVSEIGLRSVKSIGFSICMNPQYDRKGIRVLDYYGKDVESPIKDIIQFDSYDSSAIQIEDSDGNVVDDIMNLTYGEDYTVYWYEGTVYKELIMPAVCSCYEVTDDLEYYIPGELTKEGYATYDLSTVEPGIYLVDGGGLIQIP